MFITKAIHDEKQIPIRMEDYSESEIKIISGKEKIMITINEADKISNDDKENVEITNLKKEIKDAKELKKLIIEIMDRFIYGE